VDKKKSLVTIAVLVVGALVFWLGQNGVNLPVGPTPAPAPQPAPVVPTPVVPGPSGPEPAPAPRPVARPPVVTPLPGGFEVQF
jgi:hypothetical protein